MIRKTDSYKLRYCLKCQVEGKSRKKSKIEGMGKMVALDRPYINLWFHTDCFASIQSNKELVKFLTENEEIWNKKA